MYLMSLLITIILPIKSSLFFLSLISTVSSISLLSVRTRKVFCSHFLLSLFMGHFPLPVLKSSARQNFFKLQYVTYGKIQINACGRGEPIDFFGTGDFWAIGQNYIILPSFLEILLNVEYPISTS